MDTPEQPTIWPPAPTLAPPEKSDPPRFALRLPAWLVKTLRTTVGLTIWVMVALPALDYVISVVQHRRFHMMHWSTCATIPVVLFVFYGFFNWRDAKVKGKSDG